jgi:putative hydrolase of the HAD superfamily
LPTLSKRFHSALQASEQVLRARGYRTDPPFERDRWRQIVADVFHDQPHPEAPLEELWEHFRQPAAWRCFSDVGAALDSLAIRGIVLGIASNFDDRLYRVAAGHAELNPCTQFVVSAEVGWHKPAQEFFRCLVRRAKLPPENILLVGDSFEHDFAGAQAAGLNALLIDRQNSLTVGTRIRSLRELPDWLLAECGL